MRGPVDIYEDGVLVRQYQEYDEELVLGVGSYHQGMSDERLQHHVRLVERDAVVSGYEKAKREFRTAWREVPRRAKLWGKSDSEIDKRAFFQAVSERQRAREQFVLARAAYRSLK